MFDHVSKRTNADESAVRAAVERMIVNREGPDGGAVDRAVSDFLAASLTTCFHSSAAGAGRIISLEEARKFRNVLFVRCPLKRFVSGVVDKHIEGPFTSIFRPESFLDAARKISSLERHHFSPQASEAYLPELSYERVFDIESIDYKYLSDLLGMNVEPRVRHRQIDFSGDCISGLPSLPYDDLVAMKKAGGMPRHDCFYDEESRNIVLKYYEKDFDLMRRWSIPSVA